MYNDGALRGFAEVFLRAGATGVLATAGAVGTEVAREMGVPVGTHELPVHVRAAESGAPSPPSEHVPVDAPARRSADRPDLRTWPGTWRAATR